MFDVVHVRIKISLKDAQLQSVCARIIALLACLCTVHRNICICIISVSQLLIDLNQFVDKQVFVVHTGNTFLYQTDGLRSIQVEDDCTYIHTNTHVCVHTHTHTHTQEFSLFLYLSSLCFIDIMCCQLLVLCCCKVESFLHIYQS